MIKIERQIFMGNGNHSLAQVGHLFMLLSEATHLINGLQQPVNCTEEPCPDEGERREGDEIRLRQIAKKIYLGLTGEKVIKTKEVCQ